jgi:tetratricopeptide (TPR) repeat protein
MAEAIRLAHRALDLDPRCILAASMAGSAHLDNVTMGFAVDPQFDRNEAIRLSRLALSLDENNEEALGAAAWVTALFIGDHETAMEFGDRAVACNPNDARAWRRRGWTYRHAGQYEEAIRSWERAVRVSPLDPELHNTLAGIGQSLVELRRFDEAVAVTKKALRQNPTFSPTYRALVSALAHLGRDAEAREAAARLLEVDRTFTISGWIARGWSQTNSKLLIEGLRKAWVPGSFNSLSEEEFPLSTTIFLRVSGAASVILGAWSFGRKHDAEVQLYAFDVMALDGDNLRALPLSMRKANLARLLARRPDGIFVAPFEKGEIGPDLFRAACDMGLEGLVSKRRDRPYQAGPSKHWVKVKNRKHPAMNREI